MTDSAKGSHAEGAAPDHHHRGLELLAQNQPAAAVVELERAVEGDPGHAEYLKNLGNALKANGDLQRAVACYQRCLAVSPGYGAAHYNLGLALRELNRLDEAERHFRLVLDHDPRDVDALFNVASLQAHQGRFSEAAALYRAALALAPDNPFLWYELSAALQQLDGHAHETMTSLEKAIELRPDFTDARFHLGILLEREGQLEQAMAHYRAAIAIEPGNGNYLSQLGNALAKKGRTGEAIQQHAMALERNPGLISAHLSLGSLYGLQRAHDQARRCYEAALALDPGNAVASGCLVFEKQRVCDWSGFQELYERHRRNMAGASQYEVLPFGLLSMPSTAAEQLHCARNYAQHLKRSVARLREAPPYRHARRTDKRLRIGYMSADFREHPVASLIAELFELHDRDRFETVAWSFGPDDRTPMRTRLTRAFDRFEDISPLSFAQAADRIHADGTDILVDLTGYTTYSRTEIAALRPAPVQVNYLGYPGTLGADFIDYIITDRFLTPPGTEQNLSEAPVYMPATYQVNDRKRAIAATPPRSELGLPTGAFVLACFNNTYKILPEVFAAWMRILAAVPGSVLWLLKSNDWAEDNLRREGKSRGVDPARILFAPPCPQDRHLARARAADLFLDTLPYNAHTTTSDALWVGLPVLTCAGDTFASRVAGSLLNAIGLPELVTRSLDEYEAVAVRLARNPGELKALRDKLARNRDTAPLFDTPGFTRHLETAYLQMWENYLAGYGPRAIEISAA